MTALDPTSSTVVAEAVVDLEAIAHNTETIARCTTADVMAVVKADGFGHGVLPVARTVLEYGATWLGVTTCAEALALRASGISAPVLSWMHGHDEDFRSAIRSDVDLSVSSVDHLTAIAAGAAELGVQARIHLKVDTGLRRNGASAVDWPAVVALARRLEREDTLRVRGVWSHLINADAPRAAGTREQVDLFDQAVAFARDAGLDPELLHLANSAATLDLPAAHYDLVRPGIGLYGVEPLASKNFGLRGAMTLRARAILVKPVPPGTGVSYGHDYLTTGASTLALVPLGYADGVPRQLSGWGQVSIDGRRHRVAGRVAMDQFVVDLGPDTAEVGDEVVLFGPGHDGEPTVTEWAEWAGTIPHEIFTGIGSRVPRRYVGERVITNCVEGIRHG